MQEIHLHYLNAPDVEALALTNDEIIDAVESGLAAQGRREAVIEPRMHLVPDPAVHGHFNVLRGAFRAPINRAGVKVISDYVDNYKQGLPSEVGLLLLMDPVCPTCLLGLSNIDRDLLSKLPKTSSLRTYVVHEPVIGGAARNIPGAANLAHAPVRHYWNPTGSFGRLAGAAFEAPLWELLQHVANHASYHRGQVVALLRQLGARTVSTDMLFWDRENKQGGAASRPPDPPRAPRK